MAELEGYTVSCQNWEFSAPNYKVSLQCLDGHLGGICKSWIFCNIFAGLSQEQRLFLDFTKTLLLRVRRTRKDQRC